MDEKVLSKVLQIIGVIVVAMIAFRIISFVLHGVMMLVQLGLVAVIAVLAFGVIRKLSR